MPQRHFSSAVLYHHHKNSANLSKCAPPTLFFHKVYTSTHRVSLSHYQILPYIEDHFLILETWFPLKMFIHACISITEPFPFSSAIFLLMHKGNGGRDTLDICPNFLIRYSSCAFSPFIFQAPLNPDTIASSLKAEKSRAYLSGLNYTNGILKYKLQPLKHQLLSNYYMNRLWRWKKISCECTVSPFNQN